MLPNFIVVGAAKCGTTSICDLLGQHPDVFMSDPKEPCFFSHMHEGGRTPEWYESLFRDVRAETAVGEGSTAYSHPEVIDVTARRIRDTIPDCRLIYMVRHPIDRIESDWRMRRREGWTPESISVAVREQASLIGHSLYWKNLSVYRQFFDDEQILIVFLEDFRRDPLRTLQRCFSHVGVDPTVRVGDLERPRNSAASFRADTTVSSALKRTAWARRLADCLPQSVVRPVKQLLTRKSEIQVVWQGDSRRSVAQELLPDSRALLSHCRKDADFWTLPAS